jgi:hypothetical protein
MEAPVMPFGELLIDKSIKNLAVSFPFIRGNRHAGTIFAPASRMPSPIYAAVQTPLSNKSAAGAGDDFPVTG